MELPQLKSPIDLINGMRFLCASQTREFNFKDPDSGHARLVNLSEIDISEKWDRNKKTSPVVSIKTFPKELSLGDVKEYLSIQTTISHCVANAEVINSRLLSICEQLLCSNSEETEEYRKMDFMGLRDALSNSLKRDNIIRDIQEFDSKQKLKKTSKLFFTLISDRNIYTHGVLYFFVRKNIFVLKHKDINNQVTYSEINSEILDSFTKSCQYILFYLESIQNEYSKLLRK